VQECTFFTSDFACTLDEIEIALEVFTPKARGLPPVIILRQIVEVPDLTGKKAAAKRTIGDETHCELAASREIFLFRVARPK
jgi:hypothetical protein